MSSQGRSEPEQLARQLRDLPQFRVRSGPALVWQRARWQVGIAAELAALLVLWWWVTAHLRVVDEVLLPDPHRVWQALRGLAETGTLLDHSWFTFRNFMLGYALAALVGVPLGATLGYSSFMRVLVAPFVWVAYSVPRMALAPLFIIVFGLGASSKVAVVFVMAVFPIMINVMQGAASIPPTLLHAARVFGGGQVDCLRKVVLPSLLPFILVGLRLGLASGVAGTIIGEFMGSFKGLGLLLSRSAYNFEIARALAIVVIIVIAAQIAMSALQFLKQRAVPWDTGEWS